MRQISKDYWPSKNLFLEIGDAIISYDVLSACRFDLFCNEQEAIDFLDQLSLHPSLRFTMEKKKDCSLFFLDVLIQRSDNMFLTSVYCKPTFIVLYTDWKCSVARSRKINLINTLVHCALMVTSRVKLEKELYNIFSWIIVISLCMLLTSVLFLWNYLELKRMVNQTLNRSFLSVIWSLNCVLLSLPEAFSLLLTRMRFTHYLIFLFFLILKVSVMLIMWGEPTYTCGYWLLFYYFAAFSN